MSDLQRRYVTADVFTETRFGGNPLAVVLDAEGLSTAQMQAIAREFNYSETTFVLPPADPAHTAWVRIFTPASELPFAGHPNVGTAVVLARLATEKPATVAFEEAAGLVTLRIAYARGEAVGAELTAPVAFARGDSVAAAAVADAVGLAAGDLYAGVHAPVVASAGLPFVFAELASRDALRRARPAAAALPEMLRAAGGVGVFLYTRYDPGEAADVQARMFFPVDAAIIEDPATGSANVALAGLLAALDPAPDRDLAVRVAQGVDMGRPSLLLARAVKRGGVVASTHVGGGCVPVMRGTLEVAASGD